MIHGNPKIIIRILTVIITYAMCIVNCNIYIRLLLMQYNYPSENTSCIDNFIQSISNIFNISFLNTPRQFYF